MKVVFLTLPSFPLHTGLTELCVSPLDVPQWQKINPLTKLEGEGVEKQASSCSFSTKPLDCILRGLSLSQS